MNFPDLLATVEIHIQKSSPESFIHSRKLVPHLQKGDQACLYQACQKAHQLGAFWAQELFCTIGLLDPRLTEVKPKWKNASHRPLSMFIHEVLLGLTFKAETFFLCCSLRSKGK